MRKSMLSIVVSPVLPVVGLVRVDVATPLKKTKKNTRRGDAYAKRIGVEVVLFK